MRGAIIRSALLLPAVLLCSAAGYAARPCFPPAQAGEHLHKDVCISAHVYNVAELADGTRVLDVCSPRTPDSGCRFAIVSLKQDREDVGDLQQYSGTDVNIRGTVHPVHGGAEILLSHARQFHGGAEKFRPDPVLLKDFREDRKDPVDGSAFRGGRNRNGSAYTPE